MEENIIEKIRQLKIELLNMFTDENLKNEMEIAYSKFIQNDIVLEIQIDKGFNEWLINDYIFNSKTELIDIYKEKNEIDTKLYNSYKKSVISFFSINKINDKYILKDVFDKRDYELGNDELLDETAIAFARLYPFDGKYYFVDELALFDAKYKEKLLKGIMDKFTKAREKNDYLDISEFVEINPVLLYLFSNIIDDVVIMNEENESFEVYEANYTIVSREKVSTILEKEESIVSVYSDDNIYEFYNDGELLGEIIDYKSKLEFNFLSDETRIIGKNIAENIFGDSIIHINDMIVTLDDLL